MMLRNNCNKKEDDIIFFFSLENSDEVDKKIRYDCIKGVLQWD